MPFIFPGALSARLLRVAVLAAVLCAPLGAWAQSSGSGLKDGGIDSGEYRTCGIMGANAESGAVACWGDFRISADQPPQGLFTRVSVGFDHACAINSAGRIVCWGNPASVTVAPPAGTYIALSSAQGDNCAVRADGALRCWGDTLADTMPTTGVFREVSAYNGRACAIAADGALHCWQSPGIASLGTPPAGRFMEVSLGSDHACALAVDGRVRCWGANGAGQTAADPDTRFRAISAGYRFSCAIRVDGQPVCWGANDFAQTQAPTGRFNAIATGRTHACARDDSGSVSCWGSNSSRNETLEPSYGFQQVRPGPGQACNISYEHVLSCEGEQNAATPPSGAFVDVRFGSNLDGNGVAACGIRRDGRVECWGKPLAQAPPADVRFREIAVGEDHVCGLSTDERMVCWGADGNGRTAPPQGTWLAVTSGRGFSCGQPSSLVGMPYVCWGNAPSLAEVAPDGSAYSLQAYGDNLCGIGSANRIYCAGPDSALLNDDPRAFSSFALGRRHLCAAAFSGSQEIACWGDNSQGQLQAPTGTGYAFNRFAAHEDTTCIVRYADDTMTCWGAQTRRIAARTVNLLPQRQIAAGTAHTCTVRSGRGLGCWGDDSRAQTQAPRGSALALSAGGDHSCLLGTDAAPACWGDDTHGGATPPATRMRAVDVGEFNGCGLDDAGEAQCWGWNSNGQGTPPAGALRSVATGLNHSCGVRDDGTLACWGYDAEGQATPPAGLFRDVDVGERHSCAISAAGAMQCWGMNGEGQATPPDLPGASYVALAAGAFHTCAILSHGSLACWGRNDSGQTDAPSEGRYVAVTAGFAHSCAIRDDGARLCWGENGNGQAPEVALTPAQIPAMTNTVPAAVDFGMAGDGGYAARSVRYRLLGGQPPYGLELDEYGQLRGTPQSEPGTYQFTIEGRDDNGFVASRTYSVTLLRAPDTSPPTVEPRVNGYYVFNEWYSGPFTLSWNVADAETPVTARVGCDTVSFDQDIALAPYACSATSEGGTTNVQIMLGRDSVAPDTRLLQVPPPTLYTDQVYNNIVITFDSPSTGSDLSGVAGFECNFYSASDSDYFPCSSPYTLEGLTPQEFPYRLRVRAVDRAGNRDPTPALHTFYLRRDTTLPVITPTFTGPLGDNGWYVGDVSLRWVIEDPETPFTILSGCTDQTFTTDTNGLNLACQARSLAGIAWGFAYLRRDSAPPVVLATASGAPNAAGWYRQNVAVSFTCTEAGSGLAVPCPGQQILSTEGTAIASTAHTVRDNAGLSGTANILRVNIDKTAPSLLAQPRTAANAAGWYRSDITVDFSCSDALSGLATPCPASTTISTEGVSITLPQQITDIAGNPASSPLRFNLDKTAPSVSAWATTSPNAYGWYRSDVLMSISCIDNLSGLAASCPSAVTLSQEGDAVLPTLSPVSDRAGNVASLVATPVKIDKTAPVLNVTLPPPTLLLNAVHNLQLAASDALSGILSASCSGLDTRTAGTRTVTCTATDRAGNITTRSASYRVVYGYAPLAAPLDRTDVAFEVRAPRSVVFDWRLSDAAGVGVSQASVVSRTSTVVACPATVVALTTAPMTSEQPLFVHVGNGRYQQNWWVDWLGVNECRRLSLTLDDGNTYSAIVKVVPRAMRTGGPSPLIRRPAQPSSPAPASRPMTPVAPTRVQEPRGGSQRRGTGLPAFLLWQPERPAQPPASQPRTAPAPAPRRAHATDARARVGARVQAETRTDACVEHTRTRGAQASADTCAGDAQSKVDAASPASPAAAAQERASLETPLDTSPDTSIKPALKTPPAGKRAVGTE